MRLACCCVSLLLLTIPARCDDAACHYRDAVQRAVADLELRVRELPVRGGSTLGDWLPSHPEMAAAITRELLAYHIADDRMLENGALEVDVEVPLRNFPAEVLAVLDDAGNTMLGTGTAAGRTLSTEPMDPREFWSRRVLRVGVERGFRFTGLSREEQRADALERSRGSALALVSEVVADLYLPDGRTYRELAPDSTGTVQLPRALLRGLVCTHARFDMTGSSVAADYELPLAPLAVSLGLLPQGWQWQPELAAGVDRDALVERARKDALRDYAARIALWAPGDSDAAKWLRENAQLLDSGAIDVLNPDAVAVTREIAQEKIPETVKKRLYGEAWFPVLCRGQAGAQ